MKDNIGGLKDYKTGEFVDFRNKGGLHGHSKLLLEDFLKNRPELKDASTLEDYWRIMRDTDYFTASDNPEQYLKIMQQHKDWHPNTQGYSASEDVSDSEETETDSEQSQVERDTSNDELIKSLLEPTQTPNFELDDDNAINQDFFKNFVDDKLKNGTSEEIANLGEILQKFYNENGEFQNTKENRQALAQALGEDNLKNLGQENLNSKIADYKNFLQTRINPLQEEISKLEEKHKKALSNFDNYKKIEGDELDNNVMKSLRKNIINSKKELDDKISELNSAQKILNPEPVETKPVEKFTATLNQNAKSKPTDKNLLSMLELDETPQFNPLSKNSITRNIIENFIKQKISDTQDKSLRKFLNADNKLIPNQATRQKISNQFGEELQTFGQSELDKRLEELKSRYKIERPPPRESNKEIIEQIKNLKQSALNDKNSKRFSELEQILQANDVGAMRKILQNTPPPQPQPQTLPAPPVSMNEKEIWNRAKELANLAVKNKDSKTFSKIHQAMNDKNFEDLSKIIGTKFTPTETAPKEMVDLLAELRDLEKEKSALNKELDKATNKRDYKKAAELEKQIDEVEEKIQAINAELEEFKQSPKYLEGLKKDLQDNEEHLEKLKRQNREYGETSARKKHIKETEETISRLEKEIAEIEKSAEQENFAEENQTETSEIDETPQNYLRQLQKEISDLWKQRKAEQKRQLKAAQSRDKETFTDSANKLDALKNKIDSLTEEQADFKNSSLYQEMLQDEIADLQTFKQGLEGNKDKNSLQELDKINSEIVAKEKELSDLKNKPSTEEIKNAPIKQVGANFVVEGGKNPNALKNLAESLGGEYNGKNNEFSFDTKQDAQQFLLEKSDAENAPSGDYETAGISGDNTTVETDSEKEISVQYKIVPATALNTSHKLKGDDVFENKNYPDKLQPRDRTDKNLKAKVISMRNNLKPKHLGENNWINDGAPVVREDGVVLNGNGRAMAIESAYEENKADNYKQFLIDNAEKFGFKATDIEKIDNPVLIREVTQNLDNITTDEIIKSRIGGTEFKVSETALSDAESLTLKDFDDYKENVDGDISTAANDDFCRNVLEKIVPSANERNKYFNADDKLNGDAIRRINNAIYALAFSDYDLISKNTESTNDNIKNISTAAQKAAVDFARLKLKQKENLAEKYDIGEVVADAIKLYDQVKDDKKFNSVSDYVNQERQNLFEPRQQAVLDMLQVFDNYKRNSETVKDYLKDIAKAADKKPNPNQSQLFEDDYQTAQIDELVRNVTSKYLQDIPSGNMSDLFAEEERKAGEQKAREKMLAENEKTESQKIYERGEQRAREKFQQENSEPEEVEENNLVEDNQEQQTETSQQEKSETQSQEEFKTRQEEMHENKPSIYREGNKFVVNVGEDVSNAKLMLFGTLLKKYNGKYRRGTKTFEFPKASAAMSFATNVEITKFDNDERQKMYRKARVADFQLTP